MTKFFTRNIQKNIAVAVMGIALFFGMFAGAAQAQSTNDFQAQINSLMKIIAALQTQISDNAVSEGGYIKASFSEGDKVQTASSLKVRMFPNVRGKLIRIVPNASQGIILTSQDSYYNNPTVANGYTWWRVRYEALGITGWSAEPWLERIDSNASLPPRLEEDNQVRIDTFTANGRDYDATNGPYVDLAWQTTGTESCNLFYNETHLDTRNSDDTYGLSNRVLTEKYGLPAFSGRATFELRCQSRYTQKDSTVSSFKTVRFAAPKRRTTSVKITSPNKGNFEYGERLEISWAQEGSVPKGSKACVFLKRASDGKLFSHPSDGDSCVAIAGREGRRSVDGRVLRTSGYDLAPGKYRAVVTVLGPDPKTGKDRATLSRDESNGYIVIQNSANQIDYNLDIEKVSQKNVTPGQSITLYWAEKNLKNEKANITLEGPIGSGRQTQRHIATYVPLKTGKQTVTIPVSDKLGTVVPGTYQLSIWVTNIKDGSSKQVKDSIKITVQKPKSTLGTYRGFLNGSRFILTQNISKDDAYKNCKLNVLKNESSEIYCTWQGSIILDARAQSTPDIDIPKSKPVAISVGSAVVSNSPHTTKNRLTVFASGLRGMGKGVTGKVVSGPGKYGGNTWWRVRYSNGSTVWSRADRISIATGKVLGISISVDTYTQLGSEIQELNESLQKLLK